MMYTKSKQADEKIENDMKIIVEELRKRVPFVISIILTGGFSRGEGPVKKIKGKFYPYNDYDIQVISKEKLGKDKVDEIATEISKKLGYRGIELFYPFKKEEQDIKNNFYVDLKCDAPTDLKNLLPRIRTYELKNHSKVLWGEDLRNLIPDYKIGEIPLSEGAKLLLDRMSQMIEYYSVEKKHEKESLTYFIQQAYASCCTSLLLLSGKYKIGYKNSMEILKKTYKKDFPGLYEKIPKLHLKVEQFIKWKLNPQKLPNQNVEKEWFICQKNILEVSKYFFSRFLGKNIETTGDLARGILGMRRKFYLHYLNAMMKNKIGFSFGNLSSVFLPGVSFMLKKKYVQRLNKMGIRFKPNANKSPDLIIFSSLIFLIDSIEEGNKINKNKLERARRILSMVYPVKAHDWEGLTIDYANAYIGFFMMKI